MQEVLTIEEVAAHLKVHKLTVLRALRAGELEGFRFRRAWRIKRSTLDGMMNGATPKKKRK